MFYAKNLAGVSYHNTRYISTRRVLWVSTCIAVSYYGFMLLQIISLFFAIFDAIALVHMQLAQSDWM